MAHLSDILDLDNLLRHIKAGNISRSFHGDAPYSILNYTNQAQFSRAWDDETLASRGLIVDDEFNLVARGWPKFFNHTEVAVPKFALTTPPVVTEKMDGSLGIAYPRPGGGFAIATRGSFASDQAIWATQWLTIERPDFEQPDGVTTLFEIIYPQNRIVVDYGDRAELVLLGAIRTDSGEDVPIWEIDWWDGSRADHHVGIGGMDEVYRFATSAEKDQDEGVVAVWYRPGEPAFRLKCKHPRYVQMHSLITNMSSRKVWQALSGGLDLRDVLEDTPDEFYGWVQRTIDEITRVKEEWESGAIAEFGRIGSFATRREFAEVAKQSPYTGALFALLDGKSIEALAWKVAEPRTSFPFNSLNGR